MQQVIIFLFIFAFPALSFAQPEIKFESETYDMGDVSQENITHEFEFKNTGASELVIEKLVPS